MKLTEDHYSLLKIFPSDKSYLSHKQIEDATNETWDYDKLTTLSQDLYYVEFLNGSLNTSGLRITDKGLEAKKNYEETILREKEIADLEYKKLKYDVKISERIVKTYRWTQIAAWVSFAIAVILAIKELKFWPFNK